MKDVGYLEDGACVYNLAGPVLVKKDTSEARINTKFELNEGHC